MTEVVSIDEAKLWLRVSHDEEDLTIEMLIAAATEAVLATADSWDRTTPAPDRLRLAILARVAVAFDERTNIGGAQGEDRLLNPLRILSI